MHWWVWLWISGLLWLHVGVVWNDRYEGRYSLVTWLVIANALLHVGFILAWVEPDFFPKLGPLWLGLAGISFSFSAWEAGRALRSFQKEDIKTRNPLEKQTLTNIGISVYVFQFFYLGPSLVAGLAAGLRGLS